jgi:hypothetical protein
MPPAAPQLSALTRISFPDVSQTMSVESPERECIRLFTVVLVVSMCRPTRMCRACLRLTRYLPLGPYDVRAASWRGSTVRTRSTWSRNSAVKLAKNFLVDSSVTSPLPGKISGVYVM